MRRGTRDLLYSKDRKNIDDIDKNRIHNIYTKISRMYNPKYRMMI